MKSPSYPILMLCMLIALLGCVSEPIAWEDLDVSREPLPYAVSISGFISTLPIPVEVKISEPLAYSDSLAFVPVSTATVQLFEDGDLLSTLAPSDREGVYISPDTLMGREGRAYTLVVNYNGSEYTATDTLPIAIDLLDFPQFRVVQEQSDGSLFVEMSTHNFGYDFPSLWTGWLGMDEQNARFDLYRNFEGRRVVFNHRGTIPHGVFTNRYWGTSFIANRELSQNLYRFTISETYYAYLYAKFSETDWQAGIFSSIPASVPSNVTGGGTGFFWAASVTQTTTTVGELVD